MPAGVTRSQPRALAYAEITSDVASISTAADVPGLSVTFTAGARPIWIEVWAAQWIQATAQGDGAFILTDTVPTEYARTSATVATNAHMGPIAIKKRLSALTPGTSYTFKLRASASAGSLTIKAGGTPGTNGPAFIRAYEE